MLQPARGTPLPYALMHEFIRREAIATNLDVYFFMHSDVTLGRGVVSEALRGLCVSTAVEYDSTAAGLARSSWSPLTRPLCVTRCLCPPEAGSAHGTAGCEWRRGVHS